jgi:hypothetical protein
MGDSILLTVSTGLGYTYQWVNAGNIAGAIDTFYYAKTSGYYYCKVSDSLCTSNSNSIHLNVINYTPPVVTALGPTTFCAPGSVILQTQYFGVITYQWFLNGVNISGATSHNYVATSTGNYRVRVTYSGCDSTSLPIFVNVSCLTDGGKGSTSNLRHFNSNTNDSESVYIYPNPVLEKFKLEYSHANHETITVSFFDLPGKKIMEKKFDDMEGFNSHELNVQHLAAGTYFMEVNFSSGKKIFKIVKQ